MTGKTDNAKQPAYTAPAVHRAFRLLSMLADTKGPLRLSEISERLGCSKSTTHGLVHALVREKALRKTDNGYGYYIGSALADLVFSDWNYFKINRVTRPIINALRDATSETVFLGAKLSRRVQIMMTAESGEALKISAKPGATIPYLAGAVGKVFMAQENDDALRRMMGREVLPTFTSRSIADWTAYLSELERVREQGYALDDEEYLTGVRAVAVALGNQRGPAMAVWVVGMSGSMTALKTEGIIDSTRRAAANLREAVEGVS